jgi:hypothetical protein
LLPLSQEDVTLIGMSADPLPHMVQQAVEVTIRERLAASGISLESPASARIRS